MSYSIILGDYEPQDAFDIEVKLGINKLNVARFQLPNPKNKYSGVEETQSLKISLDGKLLFDGIVDNVEDILRGGDFLGIEGVGKGCALFNKLITKDYDDVNGRTIIKEVVALVGFDNSQVDPDNEIVSTFTKEYEKVSAWNIIEEICRESAKASGEIGFYFYVNTEGTKVVVYPYDKFTSSFVAERGVNLVSYRRKKLGRTVKNKIWVYGEASKLHPKDETWTEELTNWVADHGSVELESLNNKVGSYHIKATASSINGTTRRAIFRRTFPRVLLPQIGKFWITIYGTTDLKVAYFRVLSDLSNYFETPILSPFDTGTWHYKEFPLGKSQEYDADKNPNGIWTKIGTPSWRDVKQIQFFVEWIGAVDYTCHLDGFFFDKVRWEGFAEDTVISQPKFGVREKSFTDDRLLNDADCLLVAKHFLATLKNSSRVIEAEISPANFDLVQGHNLRTVDATKNIDEYARILEITHRLGEEKTTTVELSKEPLDWTPLFLDTSRKLDLLSKGLEKK